MHRNRHITQIFLTAALMVLIGSCEKDYYYESPPPPPPVTAQPTATLEASYVATAPATLNAAYWRTAGYLKVTAQNMSTNMLYGDGLLNMTGTYTGLTSYNQGSDPGLTLKAAYDSTHLYILAEWTDLSMNLSNSSWLWYGPGDSRKTDTTGGWTSQRNNDKLALAFEINSASSSLGTFSNVGCSASCHSNGSNSQMHPDAGTVDLWKWDASRSIPLGYLEDMVATADSLADDSGQKMYARNTSGSNDRSGPMYEWDGIPQLVAQPNGTTFQADASFYLLNKTPIIGDITRGDSVFHTLGDCYACHGPHGEGGTASAMNTPIINNKSRDDLKSAMNAVGDMIFYYGSLSNSQVDDVIAYIRGLCGIPGYYLTVPDSSNADITAITNVNRAQILNATSSSYQHQKYQVLIKRKLVTNHADDSQFNLSASRTYKFGVALMDNDGKNHIGSQVETLTFK